MLNKNFSCFRNLCEKQPSLKLTVLKLYEAITSVKKLKDRTEQMQKLRHEGKTEEFEKLKNSSPCITASAVMNGKDKTKESIEAYSGLVMIDIDSHDAEAARKLKEEIKNDEYLPWVLVFNSISDGSKVLVAYDADSYSTEQAYAGVSAYLVEKHHVNAEHIDQKCGNPNRLTFLYHDAGAILNPCYDEAKKDAFPMSTWIKKAEALFGKAKVAHKKAATPLAAEAAEAEDFNIMDVEEGKYCLGKKRSNLLTAADYVAKNEVHVCDSYSEYFELVTGFAHDFPHDEEMKEACRTICQHSDNFDNDNFEKLYAQQSVSSGSQEQATITSDTSFTMCLEALGQSEPWFRGSFSDHLCYDKLPNVMKQLSELDDSSIFRDFYTIGALCMFGAANKLKYVKANDTIGTTNLYAFFIGAPANNKSKLNIIFKMPSLVNDELKEKTNTEISQWKARRNPQEVKPGLKTFTFASDLTARGVVDDLAANSGRGCITSSEAELLVASKNQKKGYSDISSLLCQAYEGEDIMLDRANDNVRVLSPQLSIVTTGTLATLYHMMDSAAFASGLASRCIIYKLPQAVDIMDLGQRDANYAKRKKKGTEAYLQKYFYDFFEMCQTLKNDVIVKTTPEQNTLLQLFSYATYFNRHDDIFVDPGYSQENTYVMPMAKRSIDRAFRIMTILAALELFEKRRGKETFFDGEEPEEITVSDDIVRAAILIAQVLTEKSFNAIEKQLKVLREQASLCASEQPTTSEDKNEKAFRKLPSTFTINDIKECLNIKRARAYEYKDIFKDAGWAVKVGSKWIKQPGSPGYEAVNSADSADSAVSGTPVSTFVDASSTESSTPTFTPSDTTTTTAVENQATVALPQTNSAAGLVAQTSLT